MAWRSVEDDMPARGEGGRGRGRGCGARSIAGPVGASSIRRPDGMSLGHAFNRLTANPGPTRGPDAVPGASPSRDVPGVARDPVPGHSPEVSDETSLPGGCNPSIRFRFPADRPRNDDRPRTRRGLHPIGRGGAGRCRDPPGPEGSAEGPVSRTYRSVRGSTNVERRGVGMLESARRASLQWRTSKRVGGPRAKSDDRPGRRGGSRSRGGGRAGGRPRAFPLRGVDQSHV